MTDNRRTVRMSDEEWAEVGRRAEAKDESISEYIRHRALSKTGMGPKFGVGDRVIITSEACAFGATIQDDGYEGRCWQDGCKCVCWATLRTDDGRVFCHVQEHEMRLARFRGKLLM